MIKFLLLFVLSFIGSVSECQTVYPYQDIKLEKPADYKETEPMVLNAANYLLLKPFSLEDESRVNALKFLSGWLAGTKDHHFFMQGIVQDINKDPNLLSLYFAAMIKYKLEHSTDYISPMIVEHNACKIVLAYCDDPKNNFKLKKKTKKKLESH